MTETATRKPTGRLEQLADKLLLLPPLLIAYLALIVTISVLPRLLTTNVLGVSDRWDPTPPVLLSIPAVLVLGSFLIHSWPKPAGAHHRLGKDFARMARWIGLLIDRRLWKRAALFAVLGAVAATLLSYALIRVPALAVSNVPDARHAAVADEPAWVGGLYFATRAVLGEEVMYRGTLIALAYVTWTYVGSRRTQYLILTGLLVVTSAWFGYDHYGWSLANAITAGINGLVYGSLALTFRSVWPAALAHAGHNFAAAFI